MAPKRAKYFCENCGEEVAANARVCPHCGKFFSAVRCPNCGYMGGVDVFKNGCPKCHYAMTHEDIYGSDYESPVKNKKQPKKEKKTAPVTSTNEKKAAANYDVPGWLMGASVLILLVLIFVAVMFVM